MRLLLIGAPASGKGTQGELLSKHFNIPSISAGQMLRDVMEENSQRGRIVKEHISVGKMAPVKITIDLIKERTNLPDCKNGFILDGFPRDLAQAKSINDVPIDKVIFLNLNEENMVERIKNRKRHDDNETTLKNRMKEFEERTMPVVEFYKKQNKLITIDANKNIDEVFNSILEGLKW